MIGSQLLLVLALAGTDPALAGSATRLTLAEQAAVADVVVDGVVVSIDNLTLDDGFVVGLVRLEVRSVLRGSVSTGKLTLRLPGSFADGKWTWGVAGFAPLIALGDELVVIGDAITATDVQMVGSEDGIFKKLPSGIVGVAADLNGNPIVDPGCTETRLVARSSDRVPVGDDGRGGETTTISGLGDTVFVADPLSVGVPWDSLLTELDVCIAAQPAADGSKTDVGGGW